MKRIALLASLLLAFGLTGCNGGPNKPNIEIVQNMMDQPAIKSQDWDPQQGDKVQMRVPPEHTVARGRPPYRFASDLAAASKVPNPLHGDTSPEVMKEGQHLFTIYCALCHGDTGNGKGRIAVKLTVKPRNLISPEAMAYTDGRIYHAITAGQGVMGRYSNQILQARQRWEVVNYVRYLQKQAKEKSKEQVK